MRPTAARGLAGAFTAAVLLLAACSGDDSTGATDVPSDTGGSPNRGPLPTIEGGLALPEVDPASMLVADGLTFDIDDNVISGSRIGTPFSFG